MGNLSTGLIEKGIEKSRVEGILELLFSLVKDGVPTL